MKIRISTRESALALVQAKMAAEYMARFRPDAEFEILGMKTCVDRRQDWSLSRAGGVGLFTKEIEGALLDARADIAVHSAKDLPVKFSEDLAVFACLPRDAFRDVLAVRERVQVPAVIASSSPRRRVQLKKLFPQAVWRDMRGNVATRLEKVASGYADATVLSEAGLLRLGISEFKGVVLKPLKPEVCVPAVGQGLIALQCRKADLPLFSGMADVSALEAFDVERAFLEEIGGGCHVPYGAVFDSATRVFLFFHEKTGVCRRTLPAGRAEALVEVRRIARALV